MSRRVLLGTFGKLRSSSFAFHPDPVPSLSSEHFLKVRSLDLLHWTQCVLLIFRHGPLVFSSSFEGRPMSLNPETRYLPHRVRWLIGRNRHLAPFDILRILTFNYCLSQLHDHAFKLGDLYLKMTA